MRTNNSWIHLLREEDSHCLSDSLREKDEFGGIDVGWLSQMIPFIQEFSSPGDLILDPFAGLGTTLIAAQLEGRKSHGIEVESSRIPLIQARWRECGFEAEAEVSHGDCVGILIDNYLSDSKSQIDLCLSSVPYFGSEWKGLAEEGQLYGAKNYSDYLDYMKNLFFLLREVLKDDAHLVLMAENIRKENGQLLPLAWDLGKVLSRYFDLYDERIICYSKQAETSSAPSLQTNRAHEYALIAKNSQHGVSENKGLQFLENLHTQGLSFFVYGGFAALIRGEKTETKDIDLIFQNTEATKKTVLNFFWDSDFDLYRNKRLLIRSELSSALTEFRYIRCINEEQIGQVDLVFLDENEFNKINGLSSHRFVANQDIYLNSQWQLEC